MLLTNILKVFIVADYESSIYFQVPNCEKEIQLQPRKPSREDPGLRLVQ